MIKKYKKKPVTVEAIQYTEQTRDECIKFANATHTMIGEEGEEYETENLRIVKIGAIMHIKLGDWIIKGTAGEFYPCKPEIFEEVYEPVLD